MLRGWDPGARLAWARPRAAFHIAQAINLDGVPMLPPQPLGTGPARPLKSARIPAGMTFGGRKLALSSSASSLSPEARKALAPPFKPPS